MPLTIRLTISGRSYDAAEGVPRELQLGDGTTVDDALAELAGQLKNGSVLPDTCLVALGGAHLGTIAEHEPRSLRDGDELVIIAPVAGG
ncbi:MAG: MoaD/ThiS family protein [Pirellulales bacterium]|nr:MoaD/ThiS family protein [Planctomycetales bacterium]